MEKNEKFTLDPKRISVAQVRFFWFGIGKGGGRGTLRYLFGSYNLVG